MCGGPAISASHSNRLDSEMGPAVMPSGGELVRVLYSWNRRLEAMVVAMVEKGMGGGGRGRMGWEG